MFPTVSTRGVGSATNPILPSILANDAGVRDVFAARLKKEAGALASNMNVPRTEIDVIEHAYVSARLAMRFGDQNARQFGNIQENRAVDRRDSMKDQINNAIGRRIGAIVAAIVQRQPELRDRAQAMVADLVNEAYRSRNLATSASDWRIGPLFEAGVDPSSWHSGDDARIAWAGPSQAFKRHYGVTNAEAPPPRQIGY